MLDCMTAYHKCSSYNTSILPTHHLNSKYVPSRSMIYYQPLLLASPGYTYVHIEGVRDTHTHSHLLSHQVIYPGLIDLMKTCWGAS